MTIFKILFILTACWYLLACKPDTEVREIGKVDPIPHHVIEEMLAYRKEVTIRIVSNEMFISDYFGLGGEDTRVYQLISNGWVYSSSYHIGGTFEFPPKEGSGDRPLVENTATPTIFPLRSAPLGAPPPVPLPTPNP